MEASDVLDLLTAFDEERLRCWVDGGWGVDALLEEQTRPHSDLDLVVLRAELDRVRTLLAGRGFEVVRDWLPTSLAFRDAGGREVDLHPVDPAVDGGGDQVLRDGATWHYDPPVTGRIAGRVVPCASAAQQLAMREAYDPRPVDHHDVRRLVQRFGLPLPPSYETHDR